RTPDDGAHRRRSARARGPGPRQGRRSPPRLLTQAGAPSPPPCRSQTHEEREMIHIATYQDLVPYRRTRALFFLPTAPHLRSFEVGRELAGERAALAGAASWAAVVILLAGA